MASNPSPELTAQILRHGRPAELAAALADARSQLLAVFDACERQLPRGLEIRYAPELNPPRWELGHVAWFEEYWIARNPHRLRGPAADPAVGRAAPWLANADALYNSSTVAHTKRWHLDLPSAANTRRYAAAVRERTLRLLEQSRDDDDGLYFFRLVLAHEDMHREAWIYMAQNLALDLAVAEPDECRAAGEIAIAGGTHRLGSEGGGFVFDNELGAHDVILAPYRIDAAPVSWARFLPFIEAGGYDDRRHWSDEGWAWRRRSGNGLPVHLRRDEGSWQRAAFGRWLTLNPGHPAMHLSRHEALAWCRWAGRRLPTEAEWEHAASTQGNAFEWGQVWEWTATPFAPFPGFEPHPYRDYSMPWFDGRPVLRGASFATSPRIRHLKYRNYFSAERNDLFAGFRSCAA